ncbi:MAG TPA: hypothetical protein PLP17_06380 [Oligoflexia bacterium]|nr:hypothetical protein [Oligoflexia bacterium]
MSGPFSESGRANCAPSAADSTRAQAPKQHQAGEVILPARPTAESTQAENDRSLAAQDRTSGTGNSCVEKPSGVDIVCHGELSLRLLTRIGITIRCDHNEHGTISLDAAKISGPAKEMTFNPVRERIEVFSRPEGVALLIIAKNDRRQRSDGSVDTSSQTARVLTIVPEQHYGALHIPGHYREHPALIRVNPEIVYQAHPDMPAASPYRIRAELYSRGIIVDARSGCVHLKRHRDVRLQLDDEGGRFARLYLAEIPFNEKTTLVQIRLQPAAEKEKAAEIAASSILLDLMQIDAAAQTLTVSPAGRVTIGRERHFSYIS